MLSHDIHNVFACLDMRTHDDLVPSQYPLLKKKNLGCHMFYSFRIISVATVIAAVLSTQTQVLFIIVSCGCLHCKLNNGALMCLNLTISLASVIVAAIAVHRTTTDCLPE